VGDNLGQEDVELARAEQRAILAPMLDGLPPRQRQIVHLRFFEGLTQSEIARRLGISQMQVSRLLTRSVAQMRSVGRAPASEDI
jgi:RNA polymerase sigma-B factor